MTEDHGCMANAADCKIVAKVRLLDVIGSKIVYIYLSWTS